MTPQEKKYFDDLNVDRASDLKTLQKPAHVGRWRSDIEKYSDKAHFVYELLQNADDALATRAEFILYKDKLIFKHNGTKKFSISDPYNETNDTKNGTLGDINSITSTANSNKINKIGKFGVGFKAVFHYCAEPKIFDGNFSFAIKNFIVPEDLNCDHTERKPDETLFEFPFSEKFPFEIKGCPPLAAYEEISKKFKALNYPTLFLSNLKEVKFRFGTIEGTYKKETESARNFGDTTAELLMVNQYTDGKSAEQRLWLFTRKDNGNDYSVGYFLDDKWRLKPVDKPAFCFFPTKKATKLHFIIHAPFLLTDSREGIKADENHNIKMISLLAELAADSLFYLRDLGLIDDGILKIIPVAEDDFNVPADEISFKPFFAAIKHKMKIAEILPTRNGYVSAKNAYWADVIRLTEIFSDKQLGALVANPDAAWVFSTIGKRNAGFIVSNYIDDVTGNGSRDEDDLLKRIDKNFIETQPLSWFHEFYKWLAESERRYLNAKYKPFFLDTNGKATAAFEGDREILFLPNDGDYPTIHPALLANPDTEKFLRENIKIDAPKLKDEIDNKILPRYESNSVTDDATYFQKIFRYYMENRTDEKTFIERLKEVIYFRTLDGKFAAPNVLYMPEPELIEYFSVANLNPFLDKEFYSALVTTENENLLLEFFRKLGVADEVRSIELQFDQRKANRWNNTCKFSKATLEERQGVIQSYGLQDLEFGFDKWKNKNWRLEFAYSTREKNWFEGYIDATINVLANILESKEPNKSLILWRRIVAFNHKRGKLKDKLVGKQEYFYWKKKYEPYTPVNVTLLRETPWLVDKRGDFKAPKDMRVDEMADGYDDVTSDSAKEVIAFLGIKESKPEDNRLTDVEKRYIEKGRRLEEVGGSEEEFQEYISQKRAKKQAAENSPLPPLNDSSPIKLSAKKIHHLDSRQAMSHTASEEDYFKSAIIDYGEELKKVKAKGDREAEKIAHLEELQRKVLDAKKYSFGWCKALLDLEILNSNENNTDNKKVSISFGRVEFDAGTQRTLILKYPSHYIPQFMEDLENIPLILRTTKTETKVAIEVAGVRHNTLSAKLKDTFKLDDMNLNEVIEARIDVTDPIFLLDELKKQFDALGFEDGFNLRDNLCENIEFVFGPPGTGKTTHLADKILALMDAAEHKKILVLTPTNKAADVLVNKIIARADNKDYLEWLLRFGTTNDATIEKSGVFHDKTFEINSKSKNVTVTTIARFPYDFFMTGGNRIFLRGINWDYIVIDEASMIMLAQILLPLYKKTPKKFIIAGDPFQIEPVTTVDLWKGENIYTLVELNSFAEPQTVPHKYAVTTLKTQYRSVPAIGRIFSSFAYNGILEHHRADSDRRPLNIDDWLEVQTLNIIKFHVSKYESIYRSRRLSGKSTYQIYSALFTFEFVKALRERIAKDFSIGIISPYRAQADLIEKLFAATKCNVQIGTIHTFQGDECDILIAVFNTPPIISSSPEMFLNRLNIINVAISRACDYLFIVMPDDDTDKIDNLRLVKRVENLFAAEGYGEFAAQDIEALIFGETNYIEENSFATGHQNVNVYAQPERKYEIRSEDNAVDVQLHEKNF